MNKFWVKNSLTGEVRGVNSEKEIRRLVVVGGSNPSNWSQIVGRKDDSPYVENNKSSKDE